MAGSEYDAFSEAFARSRQGMEWPEIDPLLEAISAGNPEGPIRILDAGCGSGRMFGVLSERFGERLRYVGIDASAGLVSIAKSEYRGADFRTLRMEDAGDSFPSGSFDAVFAIASVHHLVDDRSLLRAIGAFYELLRDGGTFAMTSWDLLSESNVSKYGKFRRSDRIFEIPFSWKTRTYRAFDPIELRELLALKKFLRVEGGSNGRNLVFTAVR